MANYYPEVNDCSESLEYTNPECGECLQPGDCADYDGNGVQFSGTLAGLEVAKGRHKDNAGGIVYSNDNDCKDKINPLIMGPIFDADNAVQIKPGLYHQSKLQSVLDSSLDSISIPTNTTLRIFNSLPGSDIILEVSGPLVIQNGLHHTISRPLAPYEVPDCMTEATTCGIVNRRPNPNTSSIDENMHLWFGDCSPRRWFEIECECNPCGPQTFYSNDYGEYTCSASATDFTSVCEKSAHPKNCNEEKENQGIFAVDEDGNLAEDIPAGTFIKFGQDGTYYVNELCDKGSLPSMFLPVTGEKWSSLGDFASSAAADTPVTFAQISGEAKGALSGVTNPNTDATWKNEDRVGCCPTSASSSSDDSSPSNCWDWQGRGDDATFANSFEAGQGIFDSAESGHIYKVLRPFTLDDVGGLPAGCKKDGSCRPSHIYDFDPGDGNGVLMEKLAVSEGWGCSDTMVVEKDDGYTEVFDCPCCSVALAPPDGKDNCGRCIPCFGSNDNDNDANDNDVDFCGEASDLILKTNCEGKSCEAGELEIIFKLCVVKVAKCDEKPPTGIGDFDPDDYIPTLGDAIFHDTVDGEKVTTQTSFSVPSIASSFTEVQTLTFQGECWKIQTSNLDLSVNLTKGLQEHDPGLTVGELDSMSGGDATFDSVDVNLNFEHPVTLKYFDGEVRNGHNHAVTFSNAEVRFCPCSDEEKESIGLFDFGNDALSNDNDAAPCDCHRNKKGVKWKPKPGKKRKEIEPEVEDGEDKEGEDRPCENGDLLPDRCPAWDAGIGYLEGDKVQMNDPANNKVIAFECIVDLDAGTFGIPPNVNNVSWVEIDGCCEEKDGKSDRRSGKQACGSCCFKTGNGTWECWQGGWGNVAGMTIDELKAETLYSIVAPNGQVKAVTAYNAWQARKDSILEAAKKFLKGRGIKEEDIPDKLTDNRLQPEGREIGDLIAEDPGIMKNLLKLGLGVSKNLCQQQADTLAKNGLLASSNPAKTAIKGKNWSYSGDRPCAPTCEDAEGEEQAQALTTMPAFVAGTTMPVNLKKMWKSRFACDWPQIDTKGTCCEDENKDEPECPVDFPFDEQKDPEPEESKSGTVKDSTCEVEDGADVRWAINFHHAGKGNTNAVVPIQDYMDLKYPVELIKDDAKYNLRIYLDANLGVSPSRTGDGDYHYEEDGAFTSYAADSDVSFDGKPMSIADAEWGFTLKSTGEGVEDLTTDEVSTFSRTSSDLTPEFYLPSYSQGIIQPDDDMADGNDNPMLGSGEALVEGGESFKGWHGKMKGGNAGLFSASGVTEYDAPIGYKGSDFKGGSTDRNGFQWDQFDNRPSLPDSEHNGFKASSQDQAEADYFTAVNQRGKTSYAASGDRDSHKYYQDGSSYGSSYDIHEVAQLEYRSNTAPVIYYKSKMIGFINGTECANFGTLIQKCCDFSPTRLKTATPHPDPQKAPNLEGCDPDPKDPQCPPCPPKQDFGECYRKGEPWEFDDDQPYLKGEWFAYFIDPNEDYSGDPDIEPYAGIGNFKVGDWLFYPGSARQLSTGKEESSGGAPHVAQITDILFHFPVGDYYPHYHNSDNVGGQIDHEFCQKVPSPEGGCELQGSEVLGSNYMWHQPVAVHGGLKEQRTDVPHHGVPWLYTEVDECGSETYHRTRHHGQAHVILCKVYDEGETISDKSAFTSKPVKIDTIAHHEYLVNLSRFAVAPKFTDSFKDGHRVSFSGQVNVSGDNQNSAYIRYNDYLKNQARYQGCMLELIPGSGKGTSDKDGAEAWRTLKDSEGGGITKQSYYPLPSDRTNREESNVIQAFNTADALDSADVGMDTLLPIPITFDQINVGKNTENNSADIRVSNVTHSEYIRIGTNTKHNYERGHKVVFDAQLGGIPFEVQQIPAPAFKKFQYYFTVRATSGCGKRLLNEAECFGNDEESCQQDPDCGTFFSDPECQFDPCEGTVDRSKLKIKNVKVVGLTLESKLERGLNKGNETVYQVNTIVSSGNDENDMDCSNVAGYIANASDNSNLEFYGYDQCNAETYGASFLSANTVSFYHQLGHVELTHGEDYMFVSKVKGFVEESC